MGMRALVTGADGFIGSHLVEHLVRSGAKVRAFVYYNAFGHWGWLDWIPSEVRSEIEVCAGDIRDGRSVREAAAGVDTIYHLAALIGIPYSYSAPDSYVDTNIKGTVNVLEAARNLGSARVLVTSTSEVYGTAKYVPIDESHPYQGQSPYSATKIGADRLAESYFRSYGLPVTIVRPFNTYGPRQSARAVIPTIITQLLDGTTEIRLGSLTPTRDLVFVRDTVRGFAELAASSAAIGEEVNLATGMEISIGELANAIIGQINPEAKILTDQSRIRPEKSEVERLVGCTRKLERLTGWKPGMPLQDGLAETIDWFRVPANRAGYKSYLYNV